MDVEYLLEFLDCTVDTGITLNTEQKVCIQSSLRLLQDQARFQRMFFWGSIQGLQRDYCIAFGARQDALDRIFYYSLNGIDWNLLPDPVSQADAPALTKKCRLRFVGDPMLYRRGNEVSEERPHPSLVGSGDMSHAKQKKGFSKGLVAESFTGHENTKETREPGDLKEEDRLALVVQSITEEAFILPRRALFKVPNKIGSVVFNKLFRGLNYMEAANMKNFVHYREPQNKWNENLLETTNANYSTDFLDTVCDDIPKNRSFSLISSYDGMLVLNRSLLWHGSTFFHILDTERYGNIYFGLGLMNFDMPFMLSPTIL